MNGTSYHQFTLAVGKTSVERVYIAVNGDESRDTAERQLKRSQRKRIIGYRLARQSSYWKEIAEKNGTPFPAPVGSPKARRKT